MSVWQCLEMGNLLKAISNSWAQLFGKSMAFLGHVIFIWKEAVWMTEKQNSLGSQQVDPKWQNDTK